MTNDNQPTVSEVTPLGLAVAPHYAKWVSTLLCWPPGILGTFTAGFTARDAEVAAADALADWVGWWLSARREEEQSKFTEMRARLDAYRAVRASVQL